MSNRSNPMRGRGRRWAAFAGALGLLMFATGLSLVVQGSSSAAKSTYPSNKVWVCKFVTDPKTATKLKLGKNGLVDVSITTLLGKGNTFNGVFPAWFNDKHGKSEALGWAGAGFPVPVADYTTNTCAYPATPTPTPTPTASSTTSSPSSTPTTTTSSPSSTPTSTTSSPTSTATTTAPTTAPTTSTPTPTSTPTKPGTRPTTVAPTPTSSPTSSATTAVATPTATPTATKPPTHPTVVIPTVVHSGMESVGTNGNESMRVLGLGLAAGGSVLMLGSMGAVRRTAKR